MTKFQTYARENHKPGDAINDMWHPEAQAEAKAMNQELEDQKKARRKKIVDVVESVADAEKELTGSIVIYVNFTGSLPKIKPLTPVEKEKLFDPTISRESAKKIKGSKPLYGEFPALDELMAFIAESREGFKKFGYPFIGGGMTVLNVNSIPDAEEFAEDIEVKLPKMVDAMLVQYPAAITKEAVEKANPGLSFLHKETDYAPAEAIRQLFTFDRKWLYPGVPEVLKEVDKARWEKERARTAKVWAEVKANGIVLLRKQVSEMTERLVESMTPDADGKRRKFYGTTITNMTEFFATFDRRNLGNDTELAGEIEKLKNLVSNKDLRDFKEDDKLRATVKANAGKVVEKLKTMLVDSTARVISFED
jgi:hypothetical protein